MARGALLLAAATLIAARGAARGLDAALHAIHTPLDPALARAVMDAHLPSVLVRHEPRMHFPVNVATGASGELLVASFMTNTVLVRPLALSDRPYILLHEGPWCRARRCTTLDGPWGLLRRALDPSVRGELPAHGRPVEELLVTSFGTDQILRFALLRGDDGRLHAAFLGAFGDSDSLDCPEGIAQAPDGSLLVASFLDDRVARFDGATLELLERLETPAAGKQGDAAACEIKGPEDVCVLPSGDVLVASYYSDRLVRLASDGTASCFAGEGPADADDFAGRMEGPVGLLCLHDRVLVTSYKDARVSAFDLEGNFIHVLARGGGLRGPTGMALSLDERLLHVASYDNNRVVTFNVTAGAAFELASGMALLA